MLWVVEKKKLVVDLSLLHAKERLIFKVKVCDSSEDPHSPLMFFNRVAPRDVETSKSLESPKSSLDSDSALAYVEVHPFFFPKYGALTDQRMVQTPPR
jgi:hypothetical protein